MKQKFSINFLMLLAVAASASFFSSCSNGGGVASDTGPFDANGNYVDELADSPSSRGGLFSKKTPLPVPADEQNLMAGNDLPPSHLSPITSGTQSYTKPKVSTSAPKERVSEPSRPRVVQSSKPKAKSKPVVAKEKPRIKAKPKVVAKKSAKKAAPSSYGYSVKQGDTLYSIAKKHGTTVSAIQRASSMSGTVIGPGKVLRIPK